MMNPEPSYIDVGMLYLTIGMLLTGAAILLNSLFRRLSSQGVVSMLRHLRAMGIGILLWVVGSGVIIGAVMGLAWGLGWLVHALNWWPY